LINHIFLGGSNSMDRIYDMSSYGKESILSKEKVMGMQSGETVRGFALVQNAQILPTKNGSKYIAGNIQIGGQMPFKIWSSSDDSDVDPFTLMSKNIDVKNMICYIFAKIDKFGGTTSLVISDMVIVEDGSVNLSMSDFYEDVYDANKWWDALISLLKKNCSEPALNMFIKLINPVKDKFITEFAAVKHHDSCKSGLIAHTTKVTKMASVIKMYPQISKRVSPDLLFIGCALHDIGKIFEYSNGTISNGGMVLSHHTYGVLFLVENKKLIVNAMGEEFFNYLLSIVEQHHGQYEEKPRTVIAYLIHKVDELDSTLTTLDKMLGEANGAQIQFFEFKLI